MIQRILALSMLVGSACANATVTFYDTKATFDLASTTVLIETFDGFTPTDTSITSPITRGIATYSAVSPSTNLWVTGPDTIYSGGGAFGANLTPFQGTVLTSSGPENIKIAFSSQLFAVGFDGYLNGLGVGAVNVYSSGFLLGTLNLPNPLGGAKVYVGIVSDTAFNEITWTTSEGGTRNTAIDSISVSAVPEPTILNTMLVGITLLFAFVAANKRQKGDGTTTTNGDA